MGLGKNRREKRGSFCRYRKALCFWSLGISLYLELFCFLSFVPLCYVICAPVLAEAAKKGVSNGSDRLAKSREGDFGTKGKVVYL